MEELNLNDEYIFQDVFYSSLLSFAIYEEEPIKFLNDYFVKNKLENNLGDVCATQTIKPEENVPNFEQVSKIKYMIAKNDELKRIIVSFKGENDLSDILVDGENFPGRVKDGFVETAFFRRSNFIPFEYFIKKNNNENYKIIFTGYSIGGTIAAFIQFKMLNHIFCLKLNHTFFYGFGCPFIPEINLDKYKRFVKTFSFFNFEKDIIVDLFNNSIDQVYFARSRYFENYPISNESKYLLMFLNNVLSNFEQDDNLINECNNFLNTYKKELLNKDKSSYLCRFGCVYSINDNNVITKETKDLHLINIDNLLTDVKMHSRKKYLKVIEKIYIEKFYKKNDKVFECFKPINDLKIEINDVNCDIKRHSNCDTYCDVILTFELKRNAGYLKNVLVKIGDTLTRVEDLQDIGKGITLKYKRKFLFDNDNFLKYKYIYLIYYSIFNYEPIELEVDFPEDHVQSIIRKERTIKSLPLDMLYIYACFYIRLFYHSEFFLIQTDLPENIYKLIYLFTQIDDIIESSLHRNKFKIDKEKSNIENFHSYLNVLLKKLEIDCDILYKLDFILEYKRFDEIINNTLNENSIKLLELFLPNLYLMQSLLLNKENLSDFLNKVLNKTNILDDNYNMIYQEIIYFTHRHDPVYNSLYFEEFINEQFIETWEEKSDREILQIARLNGQIRKILCEVCYNIGIFGTQSQINRLYIESIFKCNALDKADKFITTYSLYKNYYITDFSCMNSTDESYQIEYSLYKLFLDHNFVIVNNNDNFDDQIKIFNKIRGDQFKGNTLVYNFIENIPKYDDYFKKDICKRFDFHNNDTILISCFNKDSIVMKDSDMDYSIVIDFKKQFLELIRARIDKLTQHIGEKRICLLPNINLLVKFEDSV